MTLSELFIRGRKARRPHFLPGRFWKFFPEQKMVRNSNGGVFEPTAEEWMANDWEEYVEPEIFECWFVVVRNLDKSISCVRCDLSEDVYREERYWQNRDCYIKTIHIREEL